MHDLNDLYYFVQVVVRTILRKGSRFVGTVREEGGGLEGSDQPAKPIEETPAHHGPRMRVPRGPRALVTRAIAPRRSMSRCYGKSNASPILKLFLSPLDELMGRTQKQ